MTADWLTTLGTAAGSAWLSGVNLYATELTLGVLQRFHLVKLPGGLDMLGEWLTPKIVRALRWLIARLRGFFGSDPRESANRRRVAR
jgi:hypothetical protein